MDANNIKQYQTYLLQKQNPLNVNYSGNVDGDINSNGFKDALSSLQTSIQNKYKDNGQLEKANSFKILNESNTDIILPFAELQKAVIECFHDDQNSFPTVKQIQELFNSNPFGIEYNGPKDGVLTNEFAEKLIELENKIQEISGAQIHGKIIANNKITTTPEELKKTFSLIVSFQNFLKSPQKQAV